MLGQGPKGMNAAAAMLPGAQLDPKANLSSKPSLQHISILASSLPQPALAACMTRLHLPHRLASPKLMFCALQDEQASALHKMRAQLPAFWLPAFPPCCSASVSPAKAAGTGNTKPDAHRGTGGIPCLAAVLDTRSLHG